MSAQHFLQYNNSSFITETITAVVIIQGKDLNINRFECI